MSAADNPISASDLDLYKRYFSTLLTSDLKSNLIRFKRAIHDKFFQDMERATHVLDIVAEHAHDAKDIQWALPDIVHQIETDEDHCLHILGGVFRHYALEIHGWTLPPTQPPGHLTSEPEEKQSPVEPQSIACGNCTFYAHSKGTCSVGWAQVIDMYGHTHSVAPGDPLPSAGGHLVGMLMEVEQPPDSNCKGFLQRWHSDDATEAQGPDAEIGKTQEGT